MAESNTSQGPAFVHEAESGPTFSIWKGPQGVMRLDWTRAGVLRIAIVGHGHAEFAAPVVRHFDKVLAFTGRITVLFEYSKMATYDGSYRADTQAWGSKNRAKIDALHLHTTSKIVSMGASVANLALGGMIKVYTKRADFDVASQKLGLPINPPMPS